VGTDAQQTSDSVLLPQAEPIDVELAPQAIVTIPAYLNSSMVLGTSTLTSNSGNDKKGCVIDFRDRRHQMLLLLIFLLILFIFGLAVGLSVSLTQNNATPLNSADTVVSMTPIAPTTEASPTSSPSIWLQPALDPSASPVFFPTDVPSLQPTGTVLPSSFRGAASFAHYVVLSTIDGYTAEQIKTYEEWICNYTSILNPTVNKAVNGIETTCLLTEQRLQSWGCRRELLRFVMSRKLQERIFYFDMYFSVEFSSDTIDVSSYPTLLEETFSQQSILTEMAKAGLLVNDTATPELVCLAWECNYFTTSRVYRMTVFRNTGVFQELERIEELAFTSVMESTFRDYNPLGFNDGILQWPECDLLNAPVSGIAEIEFRFRMTYISLTTDFDSPFVPDFHSAFENYVNGVGASSIIAGLGQQVGLRNPDSLALVVLN
jgi:hypothetical protein